MRDADLFAAFEDDDLFEDFEDIEEYDTMLAELERKLDLSAKLETEALLAL